MSNKQRGKIANVYGKIRLNRVSTLCLFREGLNGGGLVVTISLFKAFSLTERLEVLGHLTVDSQIFGMMFKTRI